MLTGHLMHFIMNADIRIIANLTFNPAALTDRLSVCDKIWTGECRNSRRLQHDLTHAGHGAEAICRVLQWKSFVLEKSKKTHFVTDHNHSFSPPSLILSW